MAKRKTIPRDPWPGRNYFVLDANVLVYVVYLPSRNRRKVPEDERRKSERCIQWLQEIKRQLDSGRARVYVPDVIVAEAFKVLAKWYYKEQRFRNPAEYDRARRRLRNFVSTPHREMAKASRAIKVHDEPVNRDVIIGIDRFLELMYKNGLNVQIADLLLLSIAKYLVDFYDLPENRVFIITSDRKLVKLTRKLTEVPTAIDPTEPRYDPKKTFVGAN